MKEQTFAFMFLPDYIATYGREHVKTSLAVLPEVTKFVSAEFAIRPFLLSHPQETLQLLYKCSKDEHPNVRRFASEGSRPRLPWGLGVPMLKQHPEYIIPILEQLKADPSVYVRKSVANNLNDIAKTHPQLALTLATRWKGISKETDWIVRHGCRTLLKRGDKHALTLQGFSPDSKGKVIDLVLDKRRIKIGEDLRFSLAFINEEKLPASFRLAYGIDYITASGKRSRKIFSIKEETYPPVETFTITKRQSFKNFTTRKHYPGEHRLTILVNGKDQASTSFVLY